jgi:glutathione S-transferase
MNPTPLLTLLEVGDPGLPAHESYSPFCLKVHRALALLGLPYRRVCGPYPAAHRRHNATGQVPVLLLGEGPAQEAVADSTAIIARLGALAPPGRLPCPPEALLWEELADTALGGFVVAARWADARNWPATRRAFFGGMPTPLRALVPGRLRARTVRGLVARDVWRAGPEACWARLSALLDALEARAPGRGAWLGGEALSVADVSLFAPLHSLRTPLTPWQAAEVAARPRLTAWLDRVDAATRVAADLRPPRAPPRAEGAARGRAAA